MAESNKNRQPDEKSATGNQSDPKGHRNQYPERVFEEGEDEQNDPRPTRENLSGTPLGSDPRE
jgi:hypothetical protein